MADKMNPNFTDNGGGTSDDPQGPSTGGAGGGGIWDGPEPGSPGDPDPNHGIPTGDEGGDGQHPIPVEPGTGGPLRPRPHPDPDDDGPFPPTPHRPAVPR